MQELKVNFKLKCMQSLTTTQALFLKQSSGPFSNLCYPAPMYEWHKYERVSCH